MGWNRGCAVLGASTRSWHGIYIPPWAGGEAPVKPTQPREACGPVGLLPADPVVEGGDRDRHFHQLLRQLRLREHRAVRGGVQRAQIFGRSGNPTFDPPCARGTTYPNRVRPRIVCIMHGVERACATPARDAGAEAGEDKDAGAESKARSRAHATTSTLPDEFNELMGMHNDESKPRNPKIPSRSPAVADTTTSPGLM